MSSDLKQKTTLVRLNVMNATCITSVIEHINKICNVQFPYIVAVDFHHLQ